MKTAIGKLASFCQTDSRYASGEDFTGCVRCSARAAAFTCGLCRSGSGIATPDAVSGSTACVRNATLNFGMHSAVQCTVVKQ